eukprot:CAMPEP_0115109628 /NCGR_PEP_ID=MMETSP0227-20121206/38840_1 /TAXON_ID=89957 /ORGANISM="Polarella glacialis, Strain CCMP 1383" /LENGTH=704 /DNA_ID=CAMNT_0002508405 /DNA_START=78 /DNA_END=2192 /DNA_ORIENTATION=+
MAGQVSFANWAPSAPSARPMGGSSMVSEHRVQALSTAGQTSGTWAPQSLLLAGGLSLAASRSRKQRRGKQITMRGRADREATLAKKEEPTESMCVSMREATVRCGPEIILERIALDIPFGSRAVIVGPNGCGKTTLLSTIAGTITLENGVKEIKANSVGWLRQEATAGSTKSVLEEAVAEMEAQIAGVELEAATARLEKATPEELEKATLDFEEATSKYEGLGGYEIEENAAKVLLGLGFAREEFSRPCSQLSGGWQMKVALARALLREPELLLLDEPTNHMDAATKKWLANHLTKGLPPRTTLVLVTHDRSLLENVDLTSVIEINEKRAMRYSCKGISDWEEKRKNRAAYLALEIVKLEKSVTESKAYAAKWGAKASFATMAQSRMKDAEKKMKEIAELKAETRGLPADFKDPIDPDKQDGMLPLAASVKVVLKLPAAPLILQPPLNGRLIHLESADIAYPDHPPVITGLNFTAGINTRTVLLGPNGCGKTTMLRSMAGTLDLYAGKRFVGESNMGKAQVELFTQDLAQDLPAEMTPVEYLMKVATSEHVARAALGALGLRSGAHLSPIGALSGGEKGRVALALFTLRPADVLLLDEPTNHLDGPAVKALAEGLRNVKGAAVIISTHDQSFIDALEITHKVTVTKGVGGKPGSALFSSADGNQAAVPKSSTDQANSAAPAAEKKAPPADDAATKRRKALAAAW